MARSGAWQSACVHTRPGLSLIGRLIVCAYIAAACYDSALTAIINPFKGLSPKSTNSTSRSPFFLFFLPFHLSSPLPPFSSILSRTLSFYSPSLFCGFSVIRNGIAIVLRSELVRLRESGRFVEHTAFRAFSFPTFIHSGVARELFNLLP